MLRLLFIVQFWFVGCCIAPSALASAAEMLLTVTTLDGNQRSGNLLAWDEQSLTIKQDQESVTVDTADLLRVQKTEFESTASDPSTLIELVDGTRLPHDGYNAEGRQATVATPWSQQPLELSRDLIRYVQLDANISWREIKQQEPTEDLLVVRKKNVGEFSFLYGILGDVTEEKIAFNWDEEEISVKRSKIAALGYYHAKQPQTNEFICWFNLNGGRLPVAKLSLKGDQLEATTSSGLSFTFPVDSLRDADFSHGKLVYLSDLEPLQVKWHPRIDLPSSAEYIKQHGFPRRDQSFDGSMLSLLWPSTTSKAADGELKHYSKGLALRSRTELRYRLPEGMQRFATVAGIDPETASQGNVTLEVFAGRDSLWQGAIDGSAAPAEINVPLSGAHELRIFVDYGANLDFGDRLHLIEARVSQ